MRAKKEIIKVLTKNDFLMNIDSSEKQTIIQKVELNVKLEQIKELPQLFKLLDEVIESKNGGKPVVTA